MALKIRLARGGAKKRPFYRIVVAEASCPRDGRFVEKVGTYNPLLSRDHADRIRLKEERIQHWLSVGALPTERVEQFLSNAGLVKAKERVADPKKSAPKKRAQERAKALEAAQAAAVEKAREKVDETPVIAEEVAAVADTPSMPAEVPVVDEPPAVTPVPEETPVVEEPPAVTPVPEETPVIDEPPANPPAPEEVPVVEPTT